VELVRLTSHRETEGLSFTLSAVGIENQVVASEARGNGSGTEWAILVAEADLARARGVIAEEKGEPAPQIREPERVMEPPGTYWVVGLMVVNVLVWLTMEARGGSESYQTLLRFGAAQGQRLLAGQWWRTVTAVFLHIGAKHLIANMGTLLVFGTLVLRSWGVGRSYFIYLLAGVAGNWLSFALSPGPAVKAGASGAILGLLGLLAGARIRRIRTPGPPSRFKTWHVAAAVLAFYGFVVGVGPADHLAHLGGLLAGAVLAFLVPPPGQLRPQADLAVAISLGGTALALTLLAGLLAHRAAI
jgi:membrane associated rhomboid family serine protease